MRQQLRWQNSQMQASAQTTRASVQSQEKINNIYDQSQELLAEYRALVEQTENLKVYNDHVANFGC
ncbi:MAG: DUF3450 family protein [Rheinheimera sp.]|nr:DUF3450 family protein [Rheinheimera sp.]